MQSRHIGAAFEEKQRRHNPYPTPYEAVLRTLKAHGPMRASRLAAMHGSGARRMEVTCDELVASGQLKRDDEAFYEVVEGMG